MERILFFTHIYITSDSSEEYIEIKHFLFLSDGQGLVLYMIMWNIIACIKTCAGQLDIVLKQYFRALQIIL